MKILLTLKVKSILQIIKQEIGGTFNKENTK
jgi:hypothetical protein